MRVFDGNGNGGINEAGVKSARIGPFDTPESKGKARPPDTLSAARAGIESLSR